MGFAASQARLLLLTARKSDLEFRAQQISNAEMMLAMESEAVADEYARKLANQSVHLIIGNKTEVMSYANLSAAGYTVLEYSDGEWKKMTGAGTSEYSYVINSDAIETAVHSHHLTDEEANAIRTQAGVSIPASKWTGSLDIGGTTINIAPYYTRVKESSNIFTAGEDIGPRVLQGINRGTIRILNAKGEEVSAQNGTGFSVGYYTADDEAADAEYRRKTTAIQVKEKRLQMDMQQVEAQQKACENEMESVKKIMDKNIEKTFKVFS